ncbi:MAG: hypothetical protein NTZ93_04555 [Candidatus Beckwithbacteria bacterium]|nr:hypothetical protein [Candidatus Beckwithbacteria bacterium]
MAEKAPIPVVGFDCGKFPRDLLEQFGETAESIQVNILKLAGLMIVNERCRKIFEEEIGRPITEYFKEIADNPLETVSK